MYKIFSALICRSLFCINSNCWLRMKLTILFFIVVLFQSKASSYAQMVTLNVENQPAEVVFNQLRAQTGYDFLCTADLMKSLKPVSLSASKIMLKEALEKCLKNQPVSFYINEKNKTVIIKRRAERELVQEHDQQITISGKVTDEKGIPLQGVSVKVKNDPGGTITGQDGSYRINVAGEKSVLVFTFIGFASQEVPVLTNTVINVQLKEAVLALDEVVAIGYGTIKRRDATGAVSSIGNKDLTSVPVSSPVEAMAGRLAGVKITIPEGNPDADVIIRVRGGGSITSDNSPLFLVDGFPVNSIADIPPSDIESIDVLKDASSTAIYGSRGANGIVLVTTKSGKKGKLSISYNAYAGIKNVASKMDVLSPYDYLMWQYELHSLRNIRDQFTAVFGDFSGLDKYKGTEGVDWQEKVFGRTGTMFNHNLGISGGNEKIRFNFSYNHIDDKAILETSGYKRDNLSLKLNYDADKNISFDFSGRMARTSAKGDGISGESGGQDDLPSNSFGRIKHSVIQMPFDIKNINEDIDPDELDNGLTDPITALNDNYKERLRTNYNLNGSASWGITKWLKLRTEVGLDEYWNGLESFYGVTTTDSKSGTLPENSGKPLVQTSDVYTRTFRNTNTLNFKFGHLLSNNQSLTVLLGQETILAASDKINSRTEGLPDFFNADMAFHFLGEGDPVQYNRFYYPDNKLMSFFSRVLYDYQGKYLFTGTLRADGSSKFTPGNQWGYFPSAAVAWRMSDEPFIKRDWLDELKLRLSYGISGNNNIPAGQTLKTFGVADPKPWLSIADSWWTAGTTLNNPDLKWESTRSLDLGLDFSVFNRRLTGTAELYKNNAKDLLMEFTIMGSGYNTQYQNIGETQNKGLEISMNYAAVKRKDYGLDFSFNISFNKNKVLNLGPLTSGYTKATNWQNTEVGADFIIQPGQPIGQMYGFLTDGRYEVSDFDNYDGTKWILKQGVADATEVTGADAVRPGGLKLKNIDGDAGNKISESDKTIIGDANPLHTGGFSISGRVKGFDLMTNFTWSFGNDIYNADKIEFTSPTKYQFRNMSTIMEEGKRWTNLSAVGEIVNDPAQLAEMNKNTTLWSPYMKKSVFHSWAVEDGSFLRLATASIGYTLPALFVKKIHANNIRIYLTGYNLFCLTNYTGFDPEADTRRNNRVTPGVDYSAYPKSRQFVIGANINL